jgi:hypothetical protein
LAPKVEHSNWALILGGASGVWDDVVAWEKLYGKQWDGLVIAANDVGSHWPRELHHWVSLHPTKFKRWRELREQQQLPGGVITTWGRELDPREPQKSDHILLPWFGGSSGMFAIQVAKEIGCTRAVLCGIPMTQTPHFQQTGESFAPNWLQSNSHWRVWPRYQERMLGWVRSMSGRTQELLGVPSLEWILEA